MGNLFGGKAKKVVSEVGGAVGSIVQAGKTHKLEYEDDKVRPMPSFLDPTYREAAREKRLGVIAKSGRSSTNLSATNGTRPYVNTFLGGAL